MENKYRINTWDPNGSRPMHEVIVSLIGELNESLEAAIMEESKSDEEVRKILDNPEGIKIKELQVIDVWGIERGLRRELRNRLGDAYSFLSTKATQLIEDRNEIEIRDGDGNKNINNANRELKSTIVSQYEEIEKKVENLAREWEEKGELSEKDRKLLVYIRKVYSSALKEAIKKLFSTASSSTERVKIFPRDEQEAITNKISNLQNKISFLTIESKQKQKKEKKERYEKLELEKKELEKNSVSLKKLKNVLNSSFPNLIDNENEVDEEVQKSMVEGLIELKEVQEQVKAVIEKIEEEISPYRVETRVLVEKTKKDLEKIVGGLEKKVDLRNLSEEYQTLQIQSPKK